MPKSLEALPSFLQKLFLLPPPAFTQGPWLCLDKVCAGTCCEGRKRHRKTQVAVICGLLWVAPSQSGQTHSEFLEGLLQPEERGREPQLVRQEELIFNKERKIEPGPRQSSCQLFPSSGVSAPRSGSSTECWKMAWAY